MEVGELDDPNSVPIAYAASRDDSATSGGVKGVEAFYVEADGYSASPYRKLSQNQTPKKMPLGGRTSFHHIK